jgi:hypothetical protein
VNTYTFRLRFTVSHAPALLHDGESLELALSGLPGPCILVPFYGGLVRDAKEFVLKASGFPTEEHAREAGERTRAALRITFTDLRVGLSVGDRPSTLSFGKVVHDQASESGYELRGDAHGLLVYPDEPPVCFMSMQGSLVVTSPLDTFTEQFAKTFEKNPSSTDAVTLGLELYGLSYFETSARARFVTLISAIESSAKRVTRTSEAKDFVDDLISQTRASQLSETDKHQLAAALGNLKTESISSACRRFVEENGEPGDADTWAQCYQLRHSMLHSGSTPVELRDLLPKLDEVVRRVLLKVVSHRTSDTTRERTEQNASP